MMMHNRRYILIGWHGWMDTAGTDGRSKIQRAGTDRNNNEHDVF